MIAKENRNRQHRYRDIGDWSVYIREDNLPAKAIPAANAKNGTTKVGRILVGLILEEESSKGVEQKK